MKMALVVATPKYLLNARDAEIVSNFVAFIFLNQLRERHEH